jgi:hypothetical protein
MRPLRIEKLPLAGAWVALHVGNDGAHVEGVPAGLDIHPDG